MYISVPIGENAFYERPPSKRARCLLYYAREGVATNRIEPTPFLKKKTKSCRHFAKDKKKKICRACVWKSMKKKIRKHDIVITFLSLPAIPYFLSPYTFSPIPLRKKIIIQAMLDGFLLNKATITYFTQI